ncbi:AAC(3)-I family aminoglycoside N-acetyltransferase [Neorhizobium sp. T786]|uniref:AAC(3)-I family aminoglycoside N-acetyltransferase n=1 Tax=Pseudorhizobium xiangyangii TaxID=2883104 RepID=UPI001CFF5DFA|nr:AAC(3)-I family aminoglycoside N-acetyltransferase [Neorhizobium xiangyangii]MCB5203466.1 AAC(3)-I family aminoglycoside N-acetyltransferase [Neorhizobium xiangyangii]
MQSRNIRRLGPKDKLAFRKLNAMFGKAFDDPETYTGEPPSEDYVSNLLSKDHVIALVSLQNDEVVGGLVAYELQKFERQRLEIYIYDLAVDEKHRRRGIATALIEHLRDIARARDAWIIYVQADYGDDPAITLYTKLGTREDVMHFDISVEQIFPGQKPH